MEISQCKTKILILDACRDNPCTRSVGARGGLTFSDSPYGTFIAFSTSPGKKASDGKSGDKNGLFTKSLLRFIIDPDVPIEKVFKNVRQEVRDKSGGTQKTWDHSSLTGDFFFNSNTSSYNYSNMAFEDANFIAKNKTAKELIVDFKSYNYYVQNPAINKLGTIKIDELNNDELFVIGRNIYQAACGGSRQAEDFMFNIKKSLPKLLVDITHILNGIFYEVFFDSKGEFRDTKLKYKFIDQLAELEFIETYKDSIEFISDKLYPFRDKLIYMPGSNKKFNFLIKAKKNKNDFEILSCKLEDIEIPVSNFHEALFPQKSIYEVIKQLVNKLGVPSLMINLITTPGLKKELDRNNQIKYKSLNEEETVLIITVP